MRLEAFTGKTIYTPINRLLEGHGRYVNMQKGKSWFTAFGVQFPEAGKIQLHSAHVLIDNSAKVKSGIEEKSVKIDGPDGRNGQVGPTSAEAAAGKQNGPDGQNGRDGEIVIGKNEKKKKRKFYRIEIEKNIRGPSKFHRRRIIRHPRPMSVLSIIYLNPAKSQVDLVKKIRTKLTDLTDGTDRTDGHPTRLRRASRTDGTAKL